MSRIHAQRHVTDVKNFALAYIAYEVLVGENVCLHSSAVYADSSVLSATSTDPHPTASFIKL